MTQRNERSLKYETTRPVMVKPKSAKQDRRNSTESAARKLAIQNQGKALNQPQTDVFNASVKRIETVSPDRNNRVFNPQDQDTPTRSGENDMLGHDSATFHQRSSDVPLLEDELDQLEPMKPPVSVKVKSTFTRRPGFIDEFSKDEKAMKDMEEDFKKTALSLQKKLGIDGNGVILF